MALFTTTSIYKLWTGFIQYTFTLIATETTFIQYFVKLTYLDVKSFKNYFTGWADIEFMRVFGGS